MKFDRFSGKKGILSNQMLGHAAASWNGLRTGKGKWAHDAVGSAAGSKSLNKGAGKSGLFDMLSADAADNNQGQFRRDGILYQYPSDLGTEEVNNFILFHIYSGHNQKMVSIQRGIKALEQMQSDTSTGSSWWGGAGAVVGGVAGAAAGGVGAVAGAVVGGVAGNLIGGYEEYDVVDPVTGEVLMSKEQSASALASLQTRLAGEVHTTDLFTEAISYGGQQNLNNPDEIGQGQWMLEHGSKGVGWGTGQSSKQLTAGHRQTLRGIRGSTRILKNETRVSRAEYRAKETVALYMPHKVNELNVLEYEMSSMSGAKAMGEMISGDGNMEMLAKMGIKKLAGGVDSIMGAVGLDINSEAYTTASWKMVGNPRNELLFKQPQQRKFEFNFEFAPRTPEESEEIFMIIKTFKTHAYPAASPGGLFYLFPSEFQIEYYKCEVDPETGTVISVKENDWLNRITRSALTEINVDYAPTGTYQTFENGAPTHINLSLTFGEMELLTQQHILEGH